MIEDRMMVMEKVRNAGSTHSCPSCSKPTYCAVEAGKSGNLCWCMTVVKPYTPETSFEQCMCKACLDKT